MFQIWVGQPAALRYGDDGLRDILDILTQTKTANWRRCCEPMQLTIVCIILEAAVDRLKV